MQHAQRLLICALVLLSNTSFAADDQIKLDITRIKANDELPGILYLVPWKDLEPTSTDGHKLTLHNFFGDLYDPVLPVYDTVTAESVAPAE